MTLSFRWVRNEVSSALELVKTISFDAIRTLNDLDLPMLGQILQF